MDMEVRTLASDHVICPGCSHDFPAVSQESQERIAELEAALKPFADFYAPSMELAGDAHQLTQGSTFARKQITVGDVRRAYKTLTQ